MANDISARSWYIDTASATPLLKSQVYVKFVEVVGATASTIGDTMAEIQDQNDKSIIVSKYQTNAAGEIQTFNIENWFNGIKVPTLDTANGVTLRIHIK